MNNPKYSIVWKEFGLYSTIGLRFPVRGKQGYLPFLLYGEELEKLENKEKVELDERMLLWGILAGLNERGMFFNTRENDEILISLIPYLRQGYRFLSTEQMILDTAFTIKEKISKECAYRCLKGGLILEPDSSMIRCDIIMNIWGIITESQSNATKLMEEAIEQFEKMDLQGVLPKAGEMAVYVTFVSVYFTRPEQVLEFLEKYVYAYVENHKLKEKIKYLLENKNATLADALI